MKQFIFLLAAFFCLQQISTAQLTSLQNGGDKKAVVGERIGLTDITIHYDRPGVKGREGKIWGVLVPYGFNDLGFGTSHASPWRAGANENTTIEFSTDVKINGNDLPAGKYGFSIALGKEESILIFSKNSTSWGSFFYDSTKDALRVTVRQQPLDKEVEWLKYEFLNETPNSATIALEWENLMFPFKVEVDNNKAQLESFRNELHSNKGFDWKPWAQAANWCADSNVDLEEGLQWADYGISGRFTGDKNFTTLSAKARILEAMGKTADADSIMNEAMQMGTVNEIHGYARQLLSAKRFKEAAAAFRMNYKKFPNVFTTNVGMARCLSSEGNYKEALKYATIALPQAPDMLNKTSVETMIEKLKAGKDIN
jgi:tetratricopeptide (TPR) repeat protein